MKKIHPSKLELFEKIKMIACRELLIIPERFILEHRNPDSSIARKITCTVLYINKLMQKKEIIYLLDCTERTFYYYISDANNKLAQPWKTYNKSFVESYKTIERELQLTPIYKKIKDKIHE